MGTQAGSCSATPAGSPPPVQSDEGETCALRRAGAGCGAGAVCAPRVPKAFARCAIATGSVTCPTGLVGSTVYTGATDTRGCGSCACGTVDLACSISAMNFFSDDYCNGGAYQMETYCTPVGGSGLGDTGGNSTSYQAVWSSNGMESACQVTTGSSPQGSVTPSGAITMCCLP